MVERGMDVARRKSVHPRAAEVLLTLTDPWSFDARSV